MTQNNPSGWLLVLVFSVLFSLVLGFGIVWISIERANAVYHVSQLKKGLSQRIALNAKLQIERDRLLAPGDLRRRAAALGLHEAGSGQIRRLPAPNAAQKEER